MTDILFEFLLAIGRFFMNPIIYLALLMAVFLGYRRVKSERRHFHIRILSGWAELKGLLRESLLFAFCISVLSLGIGLTVPVELLFIVSAISFLALLFYFFHALSPIIYVAISVAILMVMNWQSWSFNLLGLEFNGMSVENDAAITITILVGLLLIAEGLLIRKKGAHFASPRFENTKRGLKAVSFLSKKVWVLPIFLIVPGEAIEAFLPYWPQFDLGSSAFSIILFPILIGYQQVARTTLPIYLYPKLGRAVLILGEVVVIGGLFAYFMPIVGWIVLCAGALLRIFISVYYMLRERKDVFAVSQKSNGVMIAAILPNSPAEKMGLKSGEMIRKVNGVEVFTKQELYEALQVNAAHCKLEVLDHQNELRLTQHVVYSKDHHQIGLIVAEKM